MEGWGKIGVQSASVLYPNSCYNESCYNEVQVYIDIFCRKNERSFCTAKAYHIFSTKILAYFRYYRLKF